MVMLSPACELMLQANFGGYAGWRREFSELIRSHSGEPGKAMLCFDAAAGKLLNTWANDGAPLLDLIPSPLAAIDSGDLSLNSALDQAIDQINWADVYARYQAAVTAASECCAIAIDDSGEPTWLDVRRDAIYEQAQEMIAGAQWRNPALVSEWLGALPNIRNVVVYCVHGHEVSRAVALRLRAAGVPARFLTGGIDAWAKAGKPLTQKPGNL